ncbi:hypothetical protein GRAN_5043 [Granulicella sibirica]|uniref:Uncharacterized protein n=1 Tax=Granulicella sibirica TaxID=2479048 RepID=A0A4V1L504_9BACT|nr:hypothetical protein GRAN_5043 [Granulicella sibirica]
MRSSKSVAGVLVCVRATPKGIKLRAKTASKMLNIFMHWILLRWR